MVGKHRAPQPGETPEYETAHDKAAELAQSYGDSVVRAADKRLHGESPYDVETGSKPPVDRDE